MGIQLHKSLRQFAAVPLTDGLTIPEALVRLVLPWLAQIDRLPPAKPLLQLARDPLQIHQHTVCGT